MSEGGIWYWKVQDKKNQPPYLDVSITALLKELPPLPHGKFWSREKDGSWTISNLPKKFKIDKVPETCSVQINDAFIEHIIMPEDTLIGICLKYKVTKDELRKYNDFFGDHFKLCKVLRIPNKCFNSDEIRSLQPRTKEVCIQQLRYMTQLGYEEASYYFENNDQNIYAAFRQYLSDREWEINHVEGSMIKSDLKPTDNLKKKLNQDGAPMVVTGTYGCDFCVSEDGTIEMVSNDIHEPLLMNERYM